MLDYRARGACWITELEVHVGLQKCMLDYRGACWITEVHVGLYIQSYSFTVYIIVL